MEFFFNEEYATFWTAISSIMGVIATTHLAWIQNHQNRIKFKDEFLNFIDKGNFQIA